jgi:hypothetical protein
MAVRETYSNFGYYQMFGAAEYAAAEMPASGELSSISIDTRGYEAVTIIVNVGSCDVENSASCMQLRLMHCDTTTSTDYVNVSSADLIGSDWSVTSGAVISFGGDSALVSGVIMDFDIPSGSTLSGQGTWAFGYIGKYRYIKLMLESTGTVDTGSIAMAAIAVPGLPANWPVCDPNA